ncbi:hypothetical protein AKO1_014625 [Acrasis kona]|uniref:tRNA-uridine aminocarboxypropyltransferase 1 n=1 Tax=Acrasis kona TaxID=1008807 RepID=A0AAW2Z0G1_9EUKA
MFKYLQLWRVVRGRYYCLQMKHDAGVRTVAMKNFQLSNNPMVELEKITEREVCGKCHHARKFYCYDCNVATSSAGKVIPKLELPVKVVVIQDAREVKGKNTACHAKIIANQDVEIFTYPDIPDYINKDNSVLLYPTDGCESVGEAIKSRSDNNKKLEYVVFIDSTWQKSKRIINNEVISTLPRIRISQHKTLFWRNQKFDIHFLSTIEAIHYFFRDYHEATNQGSYEGQYDDLLYLFLYQYEVIQRRYKNNTELTFKTALRDDYIK